MRVAGFQSLSLLDFPGRPCAIVFTQGCVFRCPYCHNPELIPQGEGRYGEEEILERLRHHKKMVDAVCVTGGEPTLQADLLPFLRLLKREGFSVKLDTNGVHPRVIESVIQERLAAYFAMDLKHTWDRYDNVIGVGVPQAIENCQKSMRLIQDSNVAHEFRTTILPGEHSLEDFAAIAKYLRPGETYAVQSFRAGKTLSSDIQASGLDSSTVVNSLRPRFPHLILVAR